MPEVIRSIDIQASPSAVWQWLATQDALRRWVSPDLVIELREGGTYRMRGADESTWISGTVLELVPEGRLVMSWLEDGSEWVHPARLLFTLTPIATGTRVTLIHDGFAGIGKPGWPGTVEAYERGVDRHQLLQRLADLVTLENAGV
jgi:uncharacterized protein YndB with AHSA1/START domain